MEATAAPKTTSTGTKASSARGKVIRRQASVPSEIIESRTLRSQGRPSAGIGSPKNTGKYNAGQLSHRPANQRAAQEQSPSSPTAAVKNDQRADKSMANQTPSGHLGKPLLGKGRLERGKQISHLGLFPQSEAKQVQRQSTSMTAEAGDHPADLEELSSPNPAVDKKLSGSWRKQVHQIAEALINYAETHPQFSSQLTGARLGKMTGLKTIKSSHNDQLTITVTFETIAQPFGHSNASGLSTPRGSSRLRPTKPVSNGANQIDVEEPKSPNVDPDKVDLTNSAVEPI